MNVASPNCPDSRAVARCFPHTARCSRRTQRRDSDGLLCWSSARSDCRRRRLPGHLQPHHANDRPRRVPGRVRVYGRGGRPAGFELAEDYATQPCRIRVRLAAALGQLARNSMKTCVWGLHRARSCSCRWRAISIPALDHGSLVMFGWGSKHAAFKLAKSTAPARLRSDRANKEFDQEIAGCRRRAGSAGARSRM